MNKFKFGDRVNVASPHWKNASDVGVVIGSNGGLNNIQFENGGYAGLVPDEFVTSATNWIPCSERMPDFNVRVLVASGNRFSHDFLLNMGTHTEWASLENWEYWMLAPDTPEEKE